MQFGGRHQEGMLLAGPSYSLDMGPAGADHTCTLLLHTSRLPTSAHSFACDRYASLERGYVLKQVCYGNACQVPWIPCFCRTREVGWLDVIEGEAKAPELFLWEANHNGGKAAAVWVRRQAAPACCHSCVKLLCGRRAAGRSGGRGPVKPQAQSACCRSCSEQRLRHANMAAGAAR